MTKITRTLQALFSVVGAGTGSDPSRTAPNDENNIDEMNLVLWNLSQNGAVEAAPSQRHHQNAQFPESIPIGDLITGSDNAAFFDDYYTRDHETVPQEVSKASQDHDSDLIDRLLSKDARVVSAEELQRAKLADEYDKAYTRDLAKALALSRGEEVIEDAPITTDDTNAKIDCVPGNQIDKGEFVDPKRTYVPEFTTVDLELPFLVGDLFNLITDFKEDGRDVSSAIHAYKEHQRRRAAVTAETEEETKEHLEEVMEQLIRWVDEEVGPTGSDAPARSEDAPDMDESEADMNESTSDMNVSTPDMTMSPSIMNAPAPDMAMSPSIMNASTPGMKKFTPKKSYLSYVSPNEAITELEVIFERLSIHRRLSEITTLESQVPSPQRVPILLKFMKNLVKFTVNNVTVTEEDVYNFGVSIRELTLDKCKISLSNFINMINNTKINVLRLLDCEIIIDEGDERNTHMFTEEACKRLIAFEIPNLDVDWMADVWDIILMNLVMCHELESLNLSDAPVLDFLPTVSFKDVFPKLKVVKINRITNIYDKASIRAINDVHDKIHSELPGISILEALPVGKSPSELMEEGTKPYRMPRAPQHTIPGVKSATQPVEVPNRQRIVPMRRVPTAEQQERIDNRTAILDKAWTVVNYLHEKRAERLDGKSRDTQN